MIHEHDDLELASAAIDFGLTEVEAARLSEAVADCPICAERARAYRRQGLLLAELPQLEPSDAVRRRVMTATVTGRGLDTRTPMLLLAAALLIGALLAVAAAVGGFVDKKTLSELPPPETTSPSASPLIAVTSASPAPGASLPPGPGTGGTATTLAANTIADVVTSNLRIRSAPRVATDSIKFEPLLQNGDRVFVIAGPVVADNYDWYKVAAWRPGGVETWPIGWVVRADHDGSTWMKAAAQSCPATPTLDVVVGMNPYEALACFGNQPLTLRAYVSGGVPSEACTTDTSVPSCVTGPSWLTNSNGPAAFVDGMSGRVIDGSGPLELALDPASPLTIATLPVGRMAVIEGAFDHPDAVSCAVGGAPAAGQGLTTDDAVLRCRTTFVVSRATPDKNFLTVGGAAVTTTNGLRVRSLPLVDDTSQRLEPLLASGTRLFVLDGPAIGSGYDWYQVIAPEIKQSNGQPMVGWVAVGGKTGETWARGVDLKCPRSDQPVSFTDLARLTSGATQDGGLSCFGRQAISTTAYIRQITCAGFAEGYSLEPDWLSSPARLWLLVADTGTTVVTTPKPIPAASVTARVHPSIAFTTPCNVPADVRWAIEGHFDDPDSGTCADGAGTESIGLAAQYRCRSIFIVTKLTNLGS